MRLADADNHAFRNHFYVVDQFNGQLSGLITVLKNNHPIETVQDAEDYVSRIRGLEAVLAEFTTQLEARAEAGILPPAFAFPDVIADATAMSAGAPIDDGEPNAVYSDFSEKVAALETTASERERLAEAADAALTSPFKRGFDGLIASLNSLQSTAKGRAAFLADARALVEGIQKVAGRWFNKLPEAGLEVRRVEPWRENSVSIAFYNRPSQDGRLAFSVTRADADERNFSAQVPLFFNAIRSKVPTASE
ncbi:MAG: DUF885 domain-containing protein [Xanthomonadaceae bacterium]|nr:DUF885 domain-containing protein [Xanthomonadaceae bacterium]